MVLPRDGDGFVKSFLHDEHEGIMNFFNEYGVVVVRDVLSKRDIEDSIDAIWNQDDLTSRNVDRNDPNTWRYFPMDGKIEKKGWISSVDTLLCKQAWKNRFNPILLDVFERLWEFKKGEKQDLRVNNDRYGVMRPILEPSWKTDNGWLHTDQNPRREKEFIRVQGILSFTDSMENEGGGFLCIPGFHHKWEEYCKESRPDEEVCPFTTSTDPREEKITVRAGSLIIWDSRLPHANYPNESKDKFRFVQYITYYPSDLESAKKKRIRGEDAIYVKDIMAKQGLKFSEKEYRYIGGVN
jgi:hypothetical protein